MRYKLPFILGHDVAGIVTRVGSNVTGFAPGEEVFSRPRDLRIGTFAEYIAIDQADLAHKPVTLSFAEAGGLPLVALAAWQALVDLAELKPGQKILVQAGAGGLGSTVIQVAKHLGAYVATTAHTRDLAKVTELGADRVLDYTAENFAEVLSGYDVVLDSLSKASLKGALTVLKPGGLAISVVGPPDAAFAAQLRQPLLKPVMALLSRSVRRRARRLGVRYSFFFMQANGRQLAHLADLYDSGVLTPVLDRTFDFADTPEALAYVEHGKAKGKVVITRESAT